MTTSKKKKTSTTLCISRPYAPHARTVRFHRNENWIASSTSHSMVSKSAASSETLEMLLSKNPESNNLFSEYISNQTDIQHNDPAEASAEGKEKSKQRMHTKIMEEWLIYWDTYLQEMLHHDGQEGLQVTFCANCVNSGDFSCLDCAYYMHYCQKCLVDCHRLMPLHRIRVCNLISLTIWHLNLFLALDRFIL